VIGTALSLSVLAPESDQQQVILRISPLDDWDYAGLACARPPARFFAPAQDDLLRAGVYFVSAVSCDGDPLSQRERARCIKGEGGKGSSRSEYLSLTALFVQIPRLRSG
jgi:hypothetical protein